MCVDMYTNFCTCCNVHTDALACTFGDSSSALNVCRPERKEWKESQKKMKEVENELEEARYVACVCVCVCMHVCVCVLLCMCAHQMYIRTYVHVDVIKCM